MSGNLPNIILLLAMLATSWVLLSDDDEPWGTV